MRFATWLATSTHALIETQEIYAMLTREKINFCRKVFNVFCTWQDSPLSFFEWVSIKKCLDIPAEMAFLQLLDK